MLDAWIIDRIRKEREQRDSHDQRRPLYVPRTPPPETGIPRDHDHHPEQEKRGVWDVDFTL